MITSTASRKVPSKWLKWANSYSRYSSISESVFWWAKANVFCSRWNWVPSPLCLYWTKEDSWQYVCLLDQSGKEGFIWEGQRAWGNGSLYWRWEERHEGNHFLSHKEFSFQFHVDQKKPPYHPSYSFLHETKMTGAVAGGKKRSSKNAMASEEIVMMMMIMTLLQMLMTRVQTTLSGTQAPVPPPPMCPRVSTDYHVSRYHGLRNTVVITTLSNEIDKVII